ncbi:MAG: hypothetical protein HXX81_04760 [Campylobacterales bacterium]|nr:hypothetical protein [Campylobacterales bacterium]
MYCLITASILFTGCSEKEQVVSISQKSEKEIIVTQSKKSNDVVCNSCDDRPEIKYYTTDVSECPLKHKTVVYKGICGDCQDFPVTVRENSCCVDGGCR